MSHVVLAGGVGAARYLTGALEVSRAIEVEARRLVSIAAGGRATRQTRTPEWVRAETFLAQLFSGGKLP